VYRVAKDQTVVAALAAHGIEIPTSCAQGVCGTCLTRVIDGEPDHRDLYQTDAEHARNDQFTPCCSRARSPALVLEISEPWPERKSSGHSRAIERASIRRAAICSSAARGEGATEFDVKAHNVVPTNY